MLMDFEDLCEAFGISLALDMNCWNVSNFSNVVPIISTASTVWTYFFFRQGRKLVNICGFLWNIPDILHKSTQAKLPS